MDKSIVISILVVILLVFSVVQAFQISALKNGTGGSSTAASGGETYEQMMARMHPGQAQQATRYQSNSPAMVGGC